MNHTQWNANLYLTFEAQRSQPAIDLANRLRDTNPRTIIDIGCGPGNSTAILHTTFPNADITGIDSSANMLDRAREQYPNISFSLCDIKNISGKYDLIFANASLQWIPEHRALLPNLLNQLNTNGKLAVQMPNNSDEALYSVIDTMTNQPIWGFDKAKIEPNKTLPPQEYIEILSRYASSFDIWESVYYHFMPSLSSLIEWVEATKLRPYLRILSDEAKTNFKNELLNKIAPLYPTISAQTTQSNPNQTQNLAQNEMILFRFKRLFFIATK